MCYLRSIKVKPNERYAGAGDPAEIAAFQQAVEQTAAEIKETLSDQPDRYEQVLAIHDYLCTHVSYKENSYAHTAAGVFLKNREVVCEGYAKAFKILCGRFGIPAVLIPGGALKSNGTRKGICGIMCRWRMASGTCWIRPGMTRRRISAGSIS